MVGATALLVACSTGWGAHVAAASSAPPAIQHSTASPAAGAGAARLGTTSYPVPAGARFVAPTGSDANDGSLAQPWRTLGHAVSVSPSGSTIVMRAGTYREGDITDYGKTLTIQPYPHEAVIVRGTQVTTGFVAAAGGRAWVRSGWNYQFPRNAPSVLITPAAPLADAPDMVFVDGRQLRQVADVSQVRGSTFAVDYAKHQLAIGVNPSGHTIEATTFDVALTLVKANNSIIRGIQFDEFATPYYPHAALRDYSSGVTFENDIVTQNATAGITEMGQNATVSHCTLTFNGQLGMHVYLASNIRLYASRITDNNVAGFANDQEAGGVKVMTTNAFTADSNRIDHNHGNGLWFDIGSTNAVVVHNDASANELAGIQYEISSNGTIAGNVATGNYVTGILVNESAHVQVWNNVLYGNGSGLAVWEGPRPQNATDITLRNNVLMDGNASSWALLFVDDATGHATAAQIALNADHDAYCRTTTSKPWNVMGWVNPHSQVGYRSLPLLTPATGNEAHGVPCDGTAAAGMFVNAAAGNFKLAPGSPGLGAGAPLPAAIAGTLGVTPGVPVNLGVI